MTHTTTKLTVRLYDEASRLAIIRVSRESCSLVRAAITFITSIQRRLVVASVISVNGSARTAKRVALLETRRSFRQDICSTDKRELKDLERRLNLIRKIE
jgi:RNase P/RNase MRP subunit POP5